MIDAVVMGRVGIDLYPNEIENVLHSVRGAGVLGESQRQRVERLLASWNDRSPAHVAGWNWFAPTRSGVRADVRMACCWDTASFEAEMRPTTRAVSARAASLLPVAISPSRARSWLIVAAYSWITASEGIRVLVATTIAFALHPANRVKEISLRLSISSSLSIQV